MKAFLCVLSLAITVSHAQFYGYNPNQHHVRVARQGYAPKEPEYGLPANYDFEWQVKDDYSKNDYGHRESRKDQQTQGTYHVALPDGRVQTVTYSVDGYGGYVAEVTYAGDAAYPEAAPYAPAPAPYKPAPAPAPYKPAPAPAPAPYTPAPAPAPAPYKPAPAPYRPAPVQPYSSASIVRPVYAQPAQPPSVRRYTFRPATEAPAAEEPAPVEAAPVEAAPAEAAPAETEAPVEAAPEEVPVEIRIAEEPVVEEAASEAPETEPAYTTSAPSYYYRYY